MQGSHKQMQLSLKEPMTVKKGTRAEGFVTMTSMRKATLN